MSKSNVIPLHERDKQVGKGLRFDVFKRDFFTCQYCGAQPPKVRLECDHIHPLSKGGKTVQENLITACEDCNKGKSNKILGEAIQRPDCDLLYLKTQQEIAELRRYQDLAAEREQLIERVIESLQDRWQDISGLDWVPKDYLFVQMIERHSVAVVDSAVSVVAKKIADGDISEKSSSWVPYLWGVAKRIESRLGGAQNA